MAKSDVPDEDEEEEDDLGASVDRIMASANGSFTKNWRSVKVTLALPPAAETAWGGTAGAELLPETLADKPPVLGGATGAAGAAGAAGAGPVAAAAAGPVAAAGAADLPVWPCTRAPNTIARIVFMSAREERS